MKRKFTVLVILIILLAFKIMSANAQTIYHYKKVADVNPVTGQKTANQGIADRFLHIIFYSNGNILQEVDENGVKPKDYVDDRFQNFSGNRNNGEYSLIKTENNILTYKHYLEHKRVQYGNTFIDKYTSFIYLSPDKKKLNYYHPSDNDLLKDYDRIKVYELYDTDEVGSIPQPKKMDPNNPTMLY